MQRLDPVREFPAEPAAEIRERSLRWNSKLDITALVEREQPQTIPVTLAVLVYDVTDGSHVESQALGAIHRWTVRAD